MLWGSVKIDGNSNKTVVDGSIGFISILRFLLVKCQFSMFSTVQFFCSMYYETLGGELAGASKKSEIRRTHGT